MATLIEQVYVIPIGKTDLYDLDYIKTLIKLKSSTNKRRVQSEKSYERFIEDVKDTHRSLTPKKSLPKISILKSSK